MRSNRRPDQGLLRDEAREQIRQALLEYADRHGSDAVLLFATARCLKWQDLLSEVQMDPADLKENLEGVKTHLRDRLRHYCDGDI